MWKASSWLRPESITQPKAHLIVIRKSWVQTPVDIALRSQWFVFGAGMVRRDGSADWFTALAFFVFERVLHSQFKNSTVLHGFTVRQKRKLKNGKSNRAVLNFRSRFWYHELRVINLPKIQILHTWIYDFIWKWKPCAVDRRAKFENSNLFASNSHLLFFPHWYVWNFYYLSAPFIILVKSWNLGISLQIAFTFLILIFPLDAAFGYYSCAFSFERVRSLPGLSLGLNETV